MPNDALILATCKFYGIKYLISFDDDFRGACEGKNIVLIDSVEVFSIKTLDRFSASCPYNPKPKSLIFPHKISVVVRVSDVVNFVKCKRLAFFSIHHPKDFPTPLKAAREIFLSLRKGFDYDWAFERFSTLYPEARDIFVEASKNFTFSDELEKLIPLKWEQYYYSEKLKLSGIVDEVHENSFLWVSLKVPKKERFENRIKAACYSILTGFDTAYVYYCYDGKLERINVSRRDKYNALRIIEKVRKVERGIIPEREESWMCEKCVYANSCKEERSTFASRFL